MVAITYFFSTCMRRTLRHLALLKLLLLLPPLCIYLHRYLSRYLSLDVLYHMYCAVAFILKLSSGFNSTFPISISSAIQSTCIFNEPEDANLHVG